MAREITYLNDIQIQQVKRLAGLGLGIEKIASVIGISKATFDRRVADQSEVADALLKGRALASIQVLETAYSMAVSGEHPVMTIFWLKVHERWRTSDDSDDLPSTSPIRIGYDHTKSFKSQRTIDITSVNKSKGVVDGKAAAKDKE